MTRARLAVAAILVLAVVAAALFWRRPGGSERAAAVLFVSNYRVDTVSAIDLTLGREVRTIPVGDSPMGLAVRGGDAPLLAVANSTSNHVTFIDPRSLEITGTAEVGKGPEYVLFSRDGGQLYATSPYDLTITILDVGRRVAAGAPIAFDRKPRSLALSPDGTRLYVLLSGEDGAVAAVDTATRTIVGTIAVGRSPTGLALNGAGTRLLAASFDDDLITVIDTAAWKPLTTVQAPTGMGLIAHPSKPLVYSLVSFEDSIAVVNYESGQVVASIAAGQYPSYGTIAADGRTLYVPMEDSDNVTEIDTETNTVGLRIVVGDEPAHAVIFSPAP
jgi:YVTN family beta-propeller protein